MIVKPGYKTSELLASVVASAATWLAAWDGTLEPRWAAVCTAVVAGLYSLSRSITKHGVATGGKAVVPVVAAEAVTPAAPPPAPQVQV